MAITFYYGSGSPPAWRVWLSLEHKKLPYELKLLSFSEGDLKKPEYLAVNPRGKVPAIVDDGFTLYESVAILEYLEERYPSAGLPLLPREPEARATVRRMVQEVDGYFAPANSKLVRLVLFVKEPDPAEIAEARAGLLPELERFEAAIQGDYLAGPLSAADFTLYPMLALTQRIGKKQPQHAIDEHIGPKLTAWMKRIEALPYFEKTIPPHWK
jgi:glutathione S-transferase